MRRLLLLWAMLLCGAMAAARAEAPLTSPSVIIRTAEDSEEHKIAQVTIINRHEPERTQYTVNKVWQDDDNRAGIRGPYGVQLYANGSPVGSPVMLEADTLSYTWEDLYKYEHGEEILYTADEVFVPEGYQKEVQGDTIINRYVLYMFEGKVCKHWQDSGDQDGLRPQSVTLHLCAEGIRVRSLELTEEEGAPGYTCTCEVTLGGFCVTNTHEPETLDIPVEKVWEDSANKYKYRPQSITVYLLANDVVCDEMTLTREDGWYGVFRDHAVNMEGKPIEYTVVEDEVKRYKTTVTGSAEKGFTIKNALIYGYDFSFTKIWKDDLQEHPTPQFILYNPDGTVHRTELQPPADRGDGHYVYSLVNKEDYYVVELPMEGYDTQYVNEGEAASVTDRAYAGGTIINIAIFNIPMTGDSRNLWAYLLLLAASAAGLFLMVRRKD